MTTVSTVYHLARADYRERVRRYSFLITLIATVLAAYLFLPPNHGSYVTIQMGGHRGVYNSAWVGSVVAMMSSVYLFLIGFYLIRNAIALDRQTRVGDVIAATPVGKLSYALGKALSNFAIFATMIGVLIVAAVVMQWIRGEEYAVHVWRLLLPFLTITLPVAVFVSGAALFSEASRVFSGMIGAVLWLVVWIRSLISNGFGEWDLYGMTRILSDMKTACMTTFADYGPGGGHSIGFNFREDGSLWQLTTFSWQGAPLGESDLIRRAGVLGVAILLTISSALVFDRFRRGDVERHNRISRVADRLRGVLLRLTALRKSKSRLLWPAIDGVSDLTTVAVNRHGSIATAFALIRAEWRVALFHHTLVWHVVALGLFIACLTAPFDTVHDVLWPIAWLWPVLIWSSLGCREARFNTDQIVFSTPRPVIRQLAASWTAGVCLAMLTGGGVAIRLAAAGETGSLFGWLAGSAFIPALALACGTWSHSNRLFEIVYLFLLYLCAFERVAVFDFMGITSAALASGMPAYYMIVTASLLVVAVAARRRQLQR